MNRVINEVLPTDCSPRNTSLNFRRGFWKEDSAMTIETWLRMGKKGQQTWSRKVAEEGYGLGKERGRIGVSQDSKSEAVKIDAHTTRIISVMPVPFPTGRLIRQN